MRFLAEVKKEPLYSAIGAAALETAAGRLRGHDNSTLNLVIKRRWKPNGLQADLTAVLGRLAVERGLLSFSTLQYAVRRIRESWVRATLVAAIHARHIGQPSMDALINIAVRDEDGEVAMMAANNAATSGVTIARPLKSLNRRAGIILREAGIIRRLPGGVCGISQSMCRLLGKSVAAIDWRKIFGNDYRQAERQAVLCRALADTNITAWGPAMDVFMDLLLSCLHKHDSMLGTYILGNIGGILKSTRLATHYPCTLKLTRSLHEKRLESWIVHPRVKQTGKRTGPLKHAYLRTAKPLMRAAFQEIDGRW
jgi:hypothetical protein